jgi:hypothetical protein
MAREAQQDRPPEQPLLRLRFIHLNLKDADCLPLKCQKQLTSSYSDSRLDRSRKSAIYFSKLLTRINELGCRWR